MTIRFKSPFMLAAVAGVLDLTGGFVSILFDIVWLLYDTYIKNPHILHEPTYVFILIWLVFGAICILSGLILTIYAGYRFVKGGHLLVETHHELECRLKARTTKNRKKIFNWGFYESSYYSSILWYK